MTTQVVTQNGSSEQPFAQLSRPAPQHSIEFARNAKGEPSWTVKLYFQSPDDLLYVVGDLQHFDDALKEAFKPKWALPNQSPALAEAAS